MRVLLISTVILAAAVGGARSHTPKPSDKRVPVIVPGLCPSNEMLFPGDRKNEWRCDCKPGYVSPYKPQVDNCMKPYLQGPCKKGELLYPEDGGMLGLCQDNPCKIDGYVEYQKGCYQLDKPGGPCGRYGVLKANPYSFALECFSIYSVPSH